MAVLEGKSFMAGMLAALALFAALRGLEAANQAFTVAQVGADPGKFYGQEVSIQGLIRGPRYSEKYLGKGQKLPVMNFTLYEPSGDPKYPFGKHYVSVTLPSSQFRVTPAEGSGMTVTGTLKAPSQVGSIDPD